MDRLGRYVAPPVDGLTAGKAREAVKFLSMSPIGDKPSCLVLGPVDGVRSEASDVLLKPLEEYRVGRVIPILWARDIGGVPSTLVSRCEVTWCPRGPLPEEILVPVAQELLAAWEKKDLVSVVGLIQEHEGDLDLLLPASALVLSKKLPENPDLLPLWERIHRALETGRPMFVEVLAAWLP